jgi:hypothetical protein
MFRCEIRFDEEKVKQYGYSLKAIWELVDGIFERQGVSKVAEGIYEDPDAEDGWYTYYFSYSFFNCPPIVHFCNYWKMYDPEEGDQGDGVPLLIECRDTVRL